MIREIVTDEEILSKPCEIATAEDAAIADDLVETLLASDEAMCLAANQIGETKRIVAYLNEAGRPQVMYNPRVTQKLKPYTAVEACLSRELRGAGRRRACGAQEEDRGQRRPGRAAHDRPLRGHPCLGKGNRAPAPLP